MFNRGLHKRLVRLVLIGLCLQSIVTPKAEGASTTIAIIFSEAASIVTGIAGAMSAYQHMSDMSLSMQEISSTMQNIVDGHSSATGSSIMNVSSGLQEPVSALSDEVVPSIVQHVQTEDVLSQGTLPGTPSLNADLLQVSSVKSGGPISVNGPIASRGQVVSTEKTLPQRVFPELKILDIGPSPDVIAETHTRLLEQWNQELSKMREMYKTSSGYEFCGPAGERLGIRFEKSNMGAPESARLIERCKTRYETDPGFHDFVDNDVDRFMGTLRSVNHPDLATRVSSRIAFVNEQCYYPAYKEGFNKFKIELLKYCFDKHGHLTNFELCNGMQQVISKFAASLYLHRDQYKGQFTEITGAPYTKRISTFWSISDSVLNQQSNKEIQQILALLKKGDFVNADYKAMQFRNPLARRLYEHAADAFFARCKDDPLVRGLSLMDKAHLVQDASQLQQLYKSVQARDAVKSALCKAWDIDSSAPQAVHDAVYKLCDLNDQGDIYFAQHLVDDRLHEIIAQASEKERSALVRTFYAPNGLLKDRSVHPGAKKLQMPSAILKAGYAQQRRELNKMFFIEQLINDDAKREAASTGIECIRKGLLAKDEGIQERYFDYAHEMYDALLDRDVDRQKDLLGVIDQFERADYYEKHISPQITAALKELDGMSGDSLGDSATRPKGDFCAGGGNPSPPNSPKNKRPTKVYQEPEKKKSVTESGAFKFAQAENQKYAAEFEKLGLKEISKKNLKHIVNNHTVDGEGAQSLTKSVFQQGENFMELALEAWENGKSSGEGVKIHDVGRIVGKGRNGSETTFVKVVLNGTKDSIKTIFPI